MSNMVLLYQQALESASKVAYRGAPSRSLSRDPFTGPLRGADAVAVLGDRRDRPLPFLFGTPGVRWLVTVAVAGQSLQ